MVGGVGFEPTHLKGMALQATAALQLDRPPRYIMPCQSICSTSALTTYRSAPDPGKHKNT